MGDIRSADAPAADEAAIQAEWNRIASPEGGQPAKAPDPLDEDPDAGKDGGGQGGSPPDGSAPERAADEQPGKPDPWADAPAPLREAYQATQDELAKARNHLQAQNGRLSAETRSRMALEARLSALETAKPKAEEEAKPVVDDEAKKQLREEYPDVAGPLLDVIAGLEQKVSTLSDRDASREEQAVAAQELEDQRFIAQQEQTLAEAHPDWSSTVKTTEFATWAQAQPQFIKDGLVRNGTNIVDGAEAAKIIQLFKDETAPDGETIAERRARQRDGIALPGAKIPSGTTKATTSNEEAEFARLAALADKKGTR